MTTEENKKEFTGTELCCHDCGFPYLADRQMEEGYAITAQVGECCLCGKVKTVVPIRHFNYLKLKAHQNQSNEE